MEIEATTIEDAAKNAKESNDKLARRSEKEAKLSKKQAAVDDPELKYHRGEFDPDFLRLYQNEPFLGSISMEVSKIIDTKMPTAYIGVRPNGRSYEIIMGINPKFFRAQGIRQRQGVIKHELYHMIFQHIFTRAIGEKSYAMLWNWATDLAINSIVGADNLPEVCLIPGQRPLNAETKKPLDGPYADFIEKAPSMQSSDWYFEELRKIQDQLGDQDSEIAIASGIDTMDDHDGWKDLPTDVQEEIRDKVRGLIEKGVVRADRDNSWGTIPSEIQSVIRKLVSNEIDWRSIIKNFVGRCRTMERNSSIRKINKKLPYKFPGVKRPVRASFVNFIDQSGSMSDEDIALLYSELEGLAKEVPLDTYNFDVTIDKKSHVSWKRGAKLPSVKRTRCGGTDFQCVADFCNDPDNRGKWSGVIILTDGYAPKMGAVNGARVLWVITEHGTMDAVRPGDLACQMKKERKFKNY